MDHSFLLGSLMRLESLPQSRWPRKINQLPSWRHKHPCWPCWSPCRWRTWSLQSDRSPKAVQVYAAPAARCPEHPEWGSQPQRRSRPPKYGVRFWTTCCAAVSGPFKEALVVVRVEPAINQVAHVGLCGWLPRPSD